MTIRILTQLNYSAGENPGGDSGVRFTGRLIHELQSASDAFFFYVLAPRATMDTIEQILDCERVSIIPTDSPPRIHGGDFAFDPVALYREFDFRKHDVDLLFMNQPELTAPFLNFMNRQMFHLVPSLTYVHWFDTRRPSTPKHFTHQPALIASVAGLAASTAAACNSQYGRAAIMSFARLCLSGTLADELERKLDVLPPLISSDEVRAAKRGRAPRKRTRKKTLLINHRVMKYTGVRQLIETTLPALWDERQDFRVIITNPSRARLPHETMDTPWAVNGTMAERDYFGRLWEADIVLAPHRSTHWSISTLEAVASGCLPICNQESFFVEMFEPVLARMSRANRGLFEKYCLFYRFNLATKISQALDDIHELDRFRAELSRHTRVVYNWKAGISRWIVTFEALYEGIPAMPEGNPTMDRILELLEARGEVSKSELLRLLRWTPKSRTLSWTAFRKTLRSHAEDDPGSSELIFRKT